MQVAQYKPFEPDFDQWNPSDEMYALLAELRYTRDKVELVWACYAHDHHGQGPFASDIARILNIAKQNVEGRMVELIAMGRAKKLHGRFVLVEGQYTHPAAAKLLSSG